MAGDAKKLQPIIIKRIKKGGHGHHGGAWKVALADFVTAMMAFFMLLWLVGSTTPQQKAGISDYFQNPTALDGVTGVSNSAIDLGGGMIATTSSDHVPDPDAPLDDNSKQLDIEAEARALEYKQLEELKQQIESVTADLIGVMGDSIEGCAARTVTAMPSPNRKATAAARRLAESLAGAPVPFIVPTLRRPETFPPPCGGADGSETPSAPGRPR